ncbi:ABC transporter permease [Kordiimonas marina]|uniref:ABC transporter permease n=1 Tax=Kordiimonas marina TaxID=2872312 RepID=UPI001FF24AA0|nr:ABC transporter permease [Kordiimonas marina]
MFGNYIKSAIRSILRQRLHTAINIAGLAVGLAACILIGLYVQDELSCDKDWAHADRIYRLGTTYTFPGSAPFVTVYTGGPVKEAFKAYWAGDVETAARINRHGATLHYGSEVFREKIAWVDPEIADIFNFKVVAGNLRQVLADKASLAVSQSFARKYFGGADPIGKVVTITRASKPRDYRVGAVYRDMPANSSLRLEAMVAIDEPAFVDTPWMFAQWGSLTNYLYFTLKPGVSIGAINSRLPAFIKKYIPVSDLTDDKAANVNSLMQLKTQALTDIHLHPVTDDKQEMKPAGSMTNVMAFMAVAVFILLIACINYMNLATARSTLRVREVALRKVMGARRGQLVFQFMGEAVLTALVALLVGVMLVEVLLPSFNSFAHKTLTLDYTDLHLVAMLVGLVAFIGLIGGIYPGLFLSGFLPAKVLKANKVTEPGGSITMRGALVVLQFAISVALMVATATVYGQKLYATTMSPGFDKDNLLVLDGLDSKGAAKKQQAFRQAVLRLPGAESAALSDSTPGHPGFDNVTTRAAEDVSQSPMMIEYQKIGPAFLDTYRMKFLAGRSYDRNRQSDGLPDLKAVKNGAPASGTIVLNKTAAKVLDLGVPEEAVGKSVDIRVGGTDDRPLYATLRVIGVVADAPFHSLKRTAGPTLFLWSRAPFYSLTVRFDGDGQAFLAKVKDLWTAMMPGQPFQYEYVDQVMAEAYEQEANSSTLLIVFSGLAIVIACLGLYGLAAFVAERRTKEIGLRKVLGATVADIVRLLVWQFSKPVLLANLIAWPVAAYGLMLWLQTFPYRMDSWLLLPFCIAAGVIALLVASLTVGGNAARVARQSPIKALRYE